MDNIDFELLQKTTEETRDGMRATRQDVKAMRNEMREGFASLKGQHE